MTPEIFFDDYFRLPNCGQKVTAKPEDLFYFPKGSVITFSNPDFGVGFFCGQRGEDEA